MNAIMHVVFCDGVFLLSPMFSRFIHVVACIMTSLFVVVFVANVLQIIFYYMFLH